MSEINPFQNINSISSNDFTIFDASGSDSNISQQSPFPVFYEKILNRPNKKVISFCLYGTKPLFYLGAELNVQEAIEIYPDYICRFYCSLDVPNLETLKQLNCEVIVPNLDTPPVFWRMFACADPSIDVCLQRDCDSIVNHRERVAVQEWLNSGKTLHFMHDCERGHFHKIMAGMWGIRKNSNFDFEQELDKFFAYKKYKKVNPQNIESGWGSGSAVYFDDQYFLSEILYNAFSNDYIEHGQENPFPNHPPIKYGGFVGDRVFASELLKKHHDGSQKELFLQSHLSIDDQMPLNGLIRDLCTKYEKVHFAVRKDNLNLLKACLSDLSNLHFVILNGDIDGVDLYLSRFNVSKVKLLGLGNYGDKVVNCGDHIDCCYTQADLPSSAKFEKYHICSETFAKFTLNPQELQIFERHNKMLGSNSKSSSLIEVENLNQFSDFTHKDGKLNLNRILQRPEETHKFLIDGLSSFAEKYIKPGAVLLEIGSYAGESAEIFLKTGRVSKIYCIDPWQNGYDNSDESSFKAPMDFVESMFDERVGKYGDTVVKLKMAAEEAHSLIEDGSVDLIYLDGEHTYDANERYLNLYNKKLKNDGYMCGHDWGYGELGKTGRSQTEAIRLFFNSEPIDVFPDNTWVYRKKTELKETNFPFPKALCINLDHRTDRWNSVKNSSIANFCEIERYSASTIRDEIKHYISCIKPQYLRPDVGDTLTLSNSEYGVILSNLSIWHKMINENIDKLLILEDDVVFKDNAPNFIIDTFQHLPNDWDVVQIAAHSGGPFINDFFGKFNGPWFIGNWAYGLSISGARKLLDIVNKSGVHGPLDNFIGDNHNELNIYYYRDMPGTQGDRAVFGSNINHCGDGNSFFKDPIL